MEHEKSILESSLLKVTQERKERKEFIATISERSSRKPSCLERLIIGALIRVSFALSNFFNLVSGRVASNSV